MSWTHYAGPERQIAEVFTPRQLKLLSKILNKQNSTLFSRPITASVWGQGWKTPVLELIQPINTKSSKTYFLRTYSLHTRINKIVHYIKHELYSSTIEKCHNQEITFTEGIRNLQFVSREVALVLCIKRKLPEDIADAITFAMHAHAEESSSFLTKLNGSSQEHELLNVLLTPLSGYDLAERINEVNPQIKFSEAYVNNLMDFGEWYLWS
jgi:hypothetical protein